MNGARSHRKVGELAVGAVHMPGQEAAAAAAATEGPGPRRSGVTAIAGEGSPVSLVEHTPARQMAVVGMVQLAAAGEGVEAAAGPLQLVAGNQVVVRIEL